MFAFCVFLTAYFGLSYFGNLYRGNEIDWPTLFFMAVGIAGIVTHIV